MSSRNYVIPRINNLGFSSINKMPSRGSGDNFVERVITVVAANLASPHCICIGVCVHYPIRIPHRAVHHNMDVFAIANDDLFVNLKSYFVWKFSKK